MLLLLVLGRGERKGALCALWHLGIVERKGVCVSLGVWDLCTCIETMHSVSVALLVPCSFRLCHDLGLRDVQVVNLLMEGISTLFSQNI